MWPNHLSVFIQASLEKRIAREMKKKGITHDEALAIINEVDAARETFIKKYTDTSRYDTRNYQLVISMDELTEDGAVDLILRYIENTNNAQ
jgi:cytidylate kinase